MAPANSKIPDAWEDDDWETQADRAADEGASLREPPAETAAPVRLSKAERLAQHAELNRKIWESAETPEPTPYHLTHPSQAQPPLSQPFKPAVKVLSRRPAPQKKKPREPRMDPVTGQLLPADPDSDSDDDGSKKAQPTPEEIRARQQRDVEEKKRRYDEARAKIFGTPSPGSATGPPSGASTPAGAATPPNGQSYGGRGGGGQASGSGGGRGGRGRGRGRGGHRNHDSRGDNGGSRPVSQAGTGGRDLYDPGYAPKPSFQRGGSNSSGGAPLSTGRSTPRDDDLVIRAPRGPDGSGRGGFGFAKRAGQGM